MKTEKLPRGVFRRGNSIGVRFADSDGKIQRPMLGLVTVKFAQQQLAIFKRQIHEGRYMKKQVRAAIVPFDQVADAGIRYYENYTRDWDTPTGRIATMKAWWSGRAASEITTAEIDAKFLEKVRSKEWSECTSNEYRVVLSKIYSLAIDRGELSVNPVEKAYRYKLNNQRTRELSHEEETKLRKVIRADYSEKEAELDLALHTGCRRSNLYGIHAKGRKEMAPLQWSNVDLDWKVLRLPRAKGGNGYVVPLNTVALDALKILRERSEGTGPVIRKPSGLEVHSCRKWFDNCLAKAGIEDFCWHDLRHSFATRLRRNRVPLEDIAVLLGHASPYRMSARYAHPDLNRLHEAVATLVPKTESQKTDTKTDTPAVVEFPTAQAV